MEKINLIQKNKSGDADAFSQWIDLHSPNIEKFAVQFGHDLQQAGLLTEKVFSRFQSAVENVSNENQALLELYQLATTVVQEIPIPLKTANVFKFEEDNLLHNQITELTIENRIPFILTSFHHWSAQDISEILNRSETEVGLSIEQAEHALGIEQLGKKIAFLKKSYDRVSLTFKKDQLLMQPIVAEEKEIIQKSPTSKKSLIIWLGGILLFLAVISIPVFTSEEYKSKANEKYIAKLKSTFESEMTNVYEELGLGEWDPKKLEERFGMEYFGREASQLFAVLERNTKDAISDGTGIDKDKVRQEYEDIMKTVELPSVMVEQLLDKPLTDNAERSKEFLTEYFRRLREIEYAYQDIFYRYEHEIEKATKNNIFDLKKYLSKKDSYPDELRNMLNKMGSQNMNLITQEGEEWSAVFPSYINNGLDDKIRKSLHGSVAGYVAILIQKNQIHTLNVLDKHFKLEEYYAVLLDMETTLFDDKEQGELYETMIGIYYSLLSNVIVSQNITAQFDEDGILKKEYRTIWERIAKGDENSPSAYAMRKIIEIMENNEWKQTINMDSITHPIYGIMEVAKAGDLDDYLWDEQMLGVNMEDFTDLSGNSVETTDPEYLLAVENAYQNLSDNNNKNALIGINPIIIIGVYLYANEQKNPGALWLMHNEETIGQTKEEFLNGWSYSKLSIQEAEIILTDDVTSGKDDTKMIPISYEKEGVLHYDGWLKWNEERQLWEMETAPKEVGKTK